MTTTQTESPTTLSRIPAGSRVKLQNFSGDRIATRRLRALGLTPGVELDILQHRGQGVVVGHDGNRVALGGAIAEHLLAKILPLQSQTH